MNRMPLVLTLRAWLPAILVISTVGCSSDAGHYDLGCDAALSLQVCRKGWACEIYIVNPGRRELEYWNTFHPTYRAWDGCPFSFWVYGRTRDEEVITRGDLSRADWWSTRALYSELVAAPLPMTTIGGRQVVKQSIDLAPILTSAYEHKLKKKIPPDALNELSEVGVRCRIWRSPDFHDSIEVQKIWTVPDRDCLKPSVVPIPGR